MTDIVVLAEEPSGRIIAEHMAQKLDLGERTLCLEHQGKGDLEQSFPRKIGYWRSQRPPRFVVMRDNDGDNCRKLKAHLLALVPERATARVKVRLVVQELESWYLGDLEAVMRAGLLTAVELSQHQAQEPLSRSRRDSLRQARVQDQDSFRRTDRIGETDRAAPQSDRQQVAELPRIRRRPSMGRMAERPMKVGDLLIDESEIVETFVRSSGPGGQSVNKVASAVELRFDVRGSRRSRRLPVRHGPGCEPCRVSQNHLRRPSW